MNHFTNLNRAEVEGIKRAMIQLIDERDLQAAISLLEASIDFFEGRKGGHARDDVQIAFRCRPCESCCVAYLSTTYALGYSPKVVNQCQMRPSITVKS